MHTAVSCSWCADVPGHSARCAHKVDVSEATVCCYLTFYMKAFLFSETYVLLIYLYITLTCPAESRTL